MTYTPSCIMAYHGSGVPIERFDYAFTGKGNDQNGSGFYFTTSVQEALSYCTRTLPGRDDKLGGAHEPTVHQVVLRMDSPMLCTDDRELSEDEVLAIMAQSPCLDSALENWDEVNDMTRPRLMRQAARNYTQEQGDQPVLRSLFWLANDFFDGHTQVFNEAVRDVLGIDGVIQPLEDSTHYVAFFPEQIEIKARWPMAQIEAQFPDLPEESTTLQEGKALIHAALANLGQATDLGRSPIEGVAGQWERAQITLDNHTDVLIAISEGGVVQVNRNPFSALDNKANITLDRIQASLQAALQATMSAHSTDTLSDTANASEVPSRTRMRG